MSVKPHLDTRHPRPSDYITLKDLFTQIHSDINRVINKQYTIQGWIRYPRDQKHTLFLTVSDGTSTNNIQCVLVREDAQGHSQFDDVAKQSIIGASVSVTGILVKSEGAGQLVDLKAISSYIICPIPKDNKNNSMYPFAKAKQTLDSIRPIQHLRSRVALFGAIQRIRSTCTHATYEYFGGVRGMTYVDIPVLTTSECEGGCQPLQVTSLIHSKTKSTIPTTQIKVKDETTGKSSNQRTDIIDFSKDFFDKPVYLTVSNQLHLECFALSLTNVYTMTIASRGEASATSKHLCSFNMIEWENCFTTLDDNIDIAERYIQHTMRQVLQHNTDELKHLASDARMPAAKNIISDLESWSSQPFIHTTHQEAVETMLEHHHSGKHTFEHVPSINDDLATEHEKYIVEVLYPNRIVVVKYYPAAVKAFYMPVLEDGIHADCYDIIAPRAGEITGASQRIWHTDELLNKMKQYNIDPKPLDWYVDLRRLGCVPHGGGGLGFDRLVMLITGAENIKDCVTFVRTVHDCEY